jgi:hypothetical protein
LPPESRTARAVNGAPWGDREELAAVAVEQLQVIASLFHHAWFKAPHPEVIPVPRPGRNGQDVPQEMVEPPRMSTRDEIRSFFGGSGVQVIYSDS